ncbi:MAG: hypothetical protein COV74_04050 [Candidatus Omnitrophica bacterium CG11_big_fil_rev_8_21_14_0_20_45_26]|uniref:Uncharacterized protein n=1 Tax=Candidatus Abzuiibacterium crystallinum TaxID=1974748 RepID=A0A2H0LQA1_9BACT|nr:MAG: hypothetical protein COV74_04050 [Candidatus Omnitrophica bacterium CG11_big_fil_rev_8_21_14_0_20_45_26]PIW65289.1 MAG: hypothetical protein COW12_02830 [Candidatus Omnitrophica bacterium CG12_big_fil_rev_8_21_14_0_65_45_16]
MVVAKESVSVVKRLAIFFTKPIVKEILISIFVAAFISSAISYIFNKRIDRDSASRDFIFNFSRIFFDNPKYRDVSIAIEEAYLTKAGQILEDNGGRFSDYEIDDYLGLLYDIYAYGEESLAKDKVIANQFQYYVCITYLNKEIRNYRNRLIKEGFSEELAHGFLDDLAARFGIDNSSDCKRL